MANQIPKQKLFLFRFFFLFFLEFEKVWEINCELLNGYKLAVNLMSREIIMNDSVYNFIYLLIQ